MGPFVFESDLNCIGAGEGGIPGCGLGAPMKSVDSGVPGCGLGSLDCSSISDERVGLVLRKSTSSNVTSLETAILRVTGL